MRIEVIYNHMQLAVGVRRHDFVHKGQRIPEPTAVEMPCLHLPAGHLQGGKQRRGAMPLVLVIESC
jgi:hypothetical protein